MPLLVPMAVGGGVALAPLVVAARSHAGAGRSALSRSRFGQARSPWKAAHWSAAARSCRHPRTCRGRCRHPCRPRRWSRADDARPTGRRRLLANCADPRRGRSLRCCRPYKELSARFARHQASGRRPARNWDHRDARELRPRRGWDPWGRRGSSQFAERLAGRDAATCGRRRWICRYHRRRRDRDVGGLHRCPHK